jgi:hypothetical protein
MYKGREYRVQKGGPNGPGLNVFGRIRNRYQILKTLVGQGKFKDMLKKNEGLRLLPGFRNVEHV